MTGTPLPLSIAIVGLGPRGLGAIEALIVKAIELDKALHFHLFDPVDWPGAGPNYSPAQTPNCVLNTPVRAIDVTPDSILNLAIGNFDDWLPAGFDPEDFPARARLGEYFSQRFRQVLARTSRHARFELDRSTITDAVKAEDGWRLHASDVVFGPFDEVLLTQGQPNKAPDPQLRRWLYHAEQKNAELVSAYPDSQLLEAAKGWREQSVAIRGLGLSTFDVLRVLTSGLGGAFADGEYRPSGLEPRRIRPFSLTGQPPLPKPAHSALDHRFDPTAEETVRFADALRLAIKSEPEKALSLLSSALLDPTLRIVRSFEADVRREDVQSWLTTECEDPGALERRAPVDALRGNIEIARGAATPTIEYAVGQIWRKWQGDLRRIFGAETVAGDVARAIVDFDEGLKRVSYGPPLRSAEELLRLIDAGIVSLSIADDPDVALTRHGWQLRDDDEETQVTAMVDAVLPSAGLDGLTDDLMVSLQDRGVVQAAGDGLGVRIHPDGRVMDRSGQPCDGLAILGRMTLGSAIAVDSIHDCFGDAPRRWAAGVMSRHVST